jgi:hypothetical protein
LYCGFGLLARLVIITTGHQASPLWLSQETNFTEKKLCFFKKSFFAKFQNDRISETFMESKNGCLSADGGASREQGGASGQAFGRALNQPP